MTISLTGLTLVADDTIPTTEVRVHPDLFDAVRVEMLRADFLRSIHAPKKVVVVHPFTSMGDEELLPPPYPFCRTPKQCAGKGYCRNDPACNN